MPPKKQSPTRFLSVGITIATFLGGIIAGSVKDALWAGKNIPTVQYVDLKYEESKKYIDDRYVVLRQEAFSHSDYNRAGMEAEYKTLSAKIDLMLDTVRMIQQQQNVENARRK